MVPFGRAVLVPRAHCFALSVKEAIYRSEGLPYSYVQLVFA